MLLILLTESRLCNHGNGRWAGFAWASLVDGSDSELVLASFVQTGLLALDHAAELLDLLDGEGLALDPLAHVLLLHLDDVVGDLGTSVTLWRSPGQVGKVLAPVNNIGLTAWGWLIYRIVQNLAIVMRQFQ